MSSLVLVRHGESRWNREGRFSGWADVDLTRTGEDQARAVGRLLRGKGFAFDLAVTSALKRTIRSQWLILDALDQRRHRHRPAHPAIGTGAATGGLHAIDQFGAELHRAAMTGSLYRHGGFNPPAPVSAAGWW